MGIDYKQLLLQFIGTLTLDENTGDVSDSISTILDRMDMDLEWDDLSDLGDQLGKMGITTLYGTSLGYDDEDDDDFVEEDSLYEDEDEVDGKAD